MSRKPAGNKAVTDIVNRLAEEARKSRADGPSSSLHGSRAALSTTINQAGTLLAKIDRDEPPRRSSLLQTVLGLSSSAPELRKRGWFFTRADAAPALTSGRIDKLLKAAAKDGTRLSLEAAVEKATEGDLQCVLPEGASDPVCEPRRS